MMIVILLSGVSLFGLLLLVLGMRGKCIDDHPLCRKCKYDLVGSEQLPANCPECGAKLSKHRATRIGNRKRRRAMLAVGMLIFATSLTTGGFFSWAQSKNFDWYPYKPFWMLYSELTNNVQPIISNRPMKPKMEIFKRLKDDKLSDRQINRLVKKALELQADQSITWDGYWGEIVEDAWYMGKATDDQLQQYMKTAISSGMHLSTRSKIRQGDTVIVDFGYNGKARTRRSSRFVMSTDYGQLQIDNIEILPYLFNDVGIYIWYQNKIISKNYVVNAPIGKHAMTLKVGFSIAPFDHDQATEFSHMSYQERLEFAEKNKILEWSDTISIPVEVVEPDAAIVEIVDAPELKIKSAMRYMWKNAS